MKCLRTSPARCLAALTLGLLLFTGGAAGQEAGAKIDLELQGEGPWIVRLPYDAQTLTAVSSWLDIHSVHPQKGYFVAQIDRPDAARLRAESFTFEVDAARTESLRRVGVALKNQTSGIPGFPCYRTVEETFAGAAQIVADHPGLATWTDVGDSWEKVDDPASGWDIQVLRLTQSSIPGPKPIFFANCTIHAREYTTAELCTRFAERLADGYGSDPDVTWILDHHEVHLMLVTNPDGRKRAETGLSWRKNTNNAYCSNSNSRGADLNRNFDFEWGCCGGSSGSQCSSTYRGPFAASEPEIEALQSYLHSIFPDQRPDDLVTPAADDAMGIAIDIHSYGELVLWPWGFTTDPAPNGVQLQTLGRKLAFFNAHEPKQAIGLYPTDGTSDDFYYGTLGVAGYVFELGTQFFESCTYFEDNVLPDNLESLLYAAKTARTPYLTPAGPDALQVTVPPQAFTAGDAVLLTAVADDTRYGTRGGVEPSQAVAAAEVYVDLAPWESGATPLAMTASDGAFDAVTEGIEATLDTTGLATGRHTLYVRAQDGAGSWGAVSAVFLHIIDPASAPVLQGTVRDADTLAPIAGATVTAGDFATTTDAGGAYSLQVPAGTYDVTAAAAGYRAETAGVTAADFQTMVEDFDLILFSGVWADDAEGGNPGWTVSAPWAITSEAAFSPTRSWTDSPGTLYGNSVDLSLSSPILDLGSYSDVKLSFRHRHDLEQGFDFGRVEVSTDGGSSWSEVAVYTGTDQTAWQAVEIALPALDSATQARFRFRLETDDSVQEDGWYLDDVLLRGVFDGNAPPAVSITAPADGASFDVGESIAFTAVASDPEDGDLAAGLAWTSSLDGAFGSGASVATSSLSEGLHTITAAVTDAGGKTGSDAIAVQVGGCTVEVDFDDGSAAGWTNDPSSTCSTGTFVVATPTEVTNGGVTTQVGGDHTSGSGNAFFSATNSGAGTDDIDGGVCIVTSPVYTIARESSLSIWTFHGQRDQGDDPGGDFFALEISTDGGATFQTLASYGDETVNAAWTETTTSVPAGSSVQLRVQAADGSGAGDLVEAGIDDLLICPTAPACVVDADCDDALYCNGVESCVAGSCQAGTPVACDDGVACTVDACDEAADACVSTPDDGACSNGLFCDGTETCDAALGCQAGAPVACDDGIGCTADACDEAADACAFTPDDGACSNGLFCDGDEICDPATGCETGIAPCSGLQCDESGDVCVECFTGGDCDDGLFCNGAETCAGGLCQPGADPCPGQSCDESGDACIAGPVAQMEWGVVSAGGSAVTVPLVKTYTSPVIVASAQYAANTTPIVTRISNLTPTSFDLRLQNPSGGAVAAETVSYLVVEEGVWTIDGVAIEAQLYTSTVTDENNSWTGEARTYGQTYTSPVVLGQVMSSNDPDFSVFWSQGSSRNSPPSSTALRTGKTVAEDPDVTRADETVAVIVIESGHGTLGGVEYEAALGADTVRGVTNSPPYTYTFATPFAAAPAVALVTMAGVDGNNGGWAYPYGAAPATATSLDLAVDEDQVGDSERNHTSEQVAYLTFATSGASP